MRTYLDFEKPIAELESKVAELKALAAEQRSVSIEEELAKVKDRLADLQAKKNAAKQIYDGACKMLGIENDLEKEEEEEAGQ